MSKRTKASTRLSAIFRRLGIAGAGSDPESLATRRPKAPAQFLEPLEPRVMLSTYTVTSPADPIAITYGTLRWAIQDANYNPGTASNPDIITFSSSVTSPISLTQGQLQITQGTTFIDGPGASNLTITGNNKTSVFAVGNGATARISGLEITGGNDDVYTGQMGPGGGIYNIGNLTLDGCVVDGNKDTGTTSDFGGGGIYNGNSLTIINSNIVDNISNSENGAGIDNDSNAQLKISGSFIAGNQTSGNGQGGGIYNANGGNVNITNTEIVDRNAATNGGGIYNAGTVVLTGDTLNGNAAFKEGGGINNQNSLTLTNSGMDSNSSTLSGAGIENGGTLTVSGSSLTHNLVTGDGSGGGIDNDGQYAVANVINSLIYGNSAPLGGGLSNGGRLNVTNSTIADNGGGLGAGIDNVYLVTINNSIVAGNLDGGTEYDVDEYNPTGDFSGQNNLIGDNSSGLVNGRFGNIVGASGTDPTSANFGSLESGGGASEVLPLLPGSLAIDKGSNALAVDANGSRLLTDQRGNIRVANATVDMGSYEFGAAPLSTPLVVTSTADNVDYVAGALTLRQAVSVADAQTTPSTITFAPGVGGQITLRQGQLQLTAGTTTAIDGPGSSLLTITGANQTSDFSIVGAKVTLSGMTITGGNDDAFPGEIGPGGGIYNVGNLTLTNCIVTGNHDTVLGGGGIFNETTLSITNSTISANKSDSGNGAGIDNDTNGQLTITNSALSGNAASSGSGGGIYNRGGGTVDISATSVDNNTAGGGGGGIYNGDGGFINLTTNSILNSNSANVGGGVYNEANSTVIVNAITASDNSAVYQGGAFENQGAMSITASTLDGNSTTNNGGGGIDNNASLVLIGSTLVDNTAVSGYGGGIFNLGSSDKATLINSTLNGNSAYDGGGIANGGTLVSNDSTVAGNSAASAGGGIYENAGSGAATLNNTLVATNTLSDGTTRSDVSGTLAAASSFNLIGDGSGGLVNGHNGNILNIANPGLGTLGNNGGPTPTMALLPGSPAINKGSNALAVDAGSQPLTTDQRGPGFARIAGGTVDIGAFEVQATTTSLVIDNTDPKASASAGWAASTYRTGYVGSNYIQDGNTGKGTKTVTYSPGLTPGSYQISLDSPGGTGLATNVPVDIYTAGGVKTTVLWNQTVSGYSLLGTFNLDGNSTVIIRTTGTTASVIADAAKFVPASAPVTVVVDNTDPKATVSSGWAASTFRTGFVGSNYVQDGNTGKGSKTVTYAPGLAPGSYQVFLTSPGGTGLATNVPVDIYTAGGGKVTVTWNQTVAGYTDLGTFNLDSNSTVVIRTTGTTASVIADAAKFVPSTETITTVDNSSPGATASAGWSTSTYRTGYIGSNYLQDGNTGKGTKTVTYAPALASGSYQIMVNSPGGTGLATNVTVDIYTAGGVLQTVTWNQTIAGWTSLGTFSLDDNSTVVITTGGTTQSVIADAVEFIGS